MPWYTGVIDYLAAHFPARALQNAGTYIAGFAPIRYVMNTGLHLSDQVQTIPRVYRSLRNHQSGRVVVDNLTYVARHDLLPLCLLSLSEHVLQTYVARDSDDEEGAESHFLIAGILMLSSTCIQLASLRLKARMTTRMILVSLNATSEFNKIEPRPKSEICLKSDCSFVDNIKGATREQIAFVANDLTIHLLGLATNMPRLTAILSVYARGRYIAKVTTPERCANHRALQSEYALALGIGNWATLFLLHLAFEKSVGLPPAFFLSFMEQILSLSQIAIAAQLKPPLQQMGQETLPYDPIDLYERSIGWLSKVMMSGLKKHVPELFRAPGEPMDWQKQIKRATYVYEFPLTKLANVLFLPHMLQSSQNFVQDPLVAPVWEEYREGMITILNEIIQFERTHPIYNQAAQWAPKTSARALKKVFNIPIPVSRLAIFILGNQKAQENIIELRQWIRSLKSGKIDEFSYKQNLFPIREEVSSEPQEVLKPVVIESLSPHQLGRRKCPEPEQMDRKSLAPVGLFASRSIPTVQKDEEISDRDLLAF